MFGPYILSLPQSWSACPSISPSMKFFFAFLFIWLPRFFFCIDLFQNRLWFRYWNTVRGAIRFALLTSRNIFCTQLSLTRAKSVSWIFYSRFCTDRIYNIWSLSLNRSWWSSYRDIWMLLLRWTISSFVL